MVPAGFVHEGWVMLKTGAGGTEGWALIVTITGDEIHVLSADLLTRMVC